MIASRPTRKVLGALTATACLTAALVLSAGASAAPAATKCTAVKAGGHTYNVSAIKVACSFADTWVGKLAGKPLAPNSRNVPIAGGPKGFTCQGGTKGKEVMPGVAANVQIAGNCAKGPGGLGGFGGGPYFNWVVVHKI